MSFELKAADIEELYRQVGPYALSKTIYLLGQRDVAEEVVQEVFLKLWQNPKSFESIRQAYTWVYTSCHNAAIDYLRARRTAAQARSTIEGILKVPESPEARVANRQLLDGIWGQLSERDVAIVAYRYIDGMQIQAIARLLDVSDKTVQRALNAVAHLNPEQKKGRAP
jgi:RNA polymerase sigma-70 factor (ECF subfamily)